MNRGGSCDCTKSRLAAIHPAYPDSVVSPIAAKYLSPARVGRPDLSVQRALFTTPMCATDACQRHKSKSIRVSDRSARMVSADHSGLGDRGREIGRGWWPLCIECGAEFSQLLRLTGVMLKAVFSFCKPMDGNDFKIVTMAPAFLTSLPKEVASNLSSGTLPTCSIHGPTASVSGKPKQTEHDYRGFLCDIAHSKRASHSRSRTPPISLQRHAGLRRTTSSARMSICRQTPSLKSVFDFDLEALAAVRRSQKHP